MPDLVHSRRNKRNCGATKLRHYELLLFIAIALPSDKLVKRLSVGNHGALRSVSLNPEVLNELLRKEVIFRFCAGTPFPMVVIAAGVKS
jgi:hypothetical protein